MKKNACILVSVFSTVALVVAAFALFFSCRKTYVCIEDELYEPVFELLCTEEILPGRFSVVSQSEFKSISSAFAGKTAKVAAVITIEKRFAFQPLDEVSDKKAYLIKSADWLPVIADDLQCNAAGLQAVPPDLDVKLKTVEEVASGERALTVAGAYAGDDGYNFRENTYAVCSLLDGAMAAEIDAWCADVFGKLKEKNAAPQSPAFIAAVGDIMVARGVQEILLNEPDGLEQVFGSTLPVLQKNHILIQIITEQPWGIAVYFQHLTVRADFCDPLMKFLPCSGKRTVRNNKRPAIQIFHGNTFFFREGMLVLHCAADRQVINEFTANIVFFRHGRVINIHRNIQICSDRAQHVMEAVRPRRIKQGGIADAEELLSGIKFPCQKELIRIMLHHTDPHELAVIIADLFYSGQRRFIFLHDPAGVFIKADAGPCHPYPFSSSLEKCTPNLIFYIIDSLLNGIRGEKKVICGFGKTSVICHADKCPDIRDHDASPSFSCSL